MVGCTRAWVLAIALAGTTSITSAHGVDSNRQPLSSGTDQTIVDIEKVAWAPLEVEGLDPGAEIVVLRGDLGKAGSELLLRLPPDYRVPMHNHTSDEVYVWIKGAFTLIAHDGQKTEFDGPAYISFPGNAPPHGLVCGHKAACVLYLRYSRPFDIHYFPESGAGGAE